MNKQYYSIEECRDMQLKKLRKHLEYLLTRSPFYKSKLTHLDIDPPNFQWEDLLKIPITTKEDIQSNPQAFHCIPPKEIVEYVTTSGTTGVPVTFALSESDLNRLGENELNSLLIAGCSSDDIIQIMVTLDKRFMAGIAYYLGARKLGAGIVRTGVESLAFQVDTIRRMKPTVLIAVPSFLLKLISYCELNGFDIAASSVKKVICIGEPIRKQDFTLNTLGSRVKEKWNIELHSTYASTEMATAFTECEVGHGGHEIPELIITEVLDVNNQPVLPEHSGELVVTPLDVTGMPLLRFKTGDVCIKHNDECPCGRKTSRIGPLEGRRKQMIKYKGTTFYPPAIFEVLNGFKEISQYLVILSTDNLEGDDVEVAYCCDINNNELEIRLKESFKAHIRVVPRLNQIDTGKMYKLTYDAMSRKPINFLDKRKNPLLH